MIASYYYDPFGRRLWKEVAGVRTYFFYADEGLIGEYDSTGTEIKTYGYKPGSTWTTDPLFMKEGTNYYFYHTDHLGTPQKMTAVNGAVVWAAKYSSFGEAAVDAISTITNNLRFPGQLYDQETGLHYNKWRYYDAGVGRYLRGDPLRLFGGDINFYNYCLSNPTMMLDPNGLTKLYFDRKSGNLFVDPERGGGMDDIYIVPSTAGKGKCMNNPACECKKDCGPIPAGNYSADISKLTNPGVWGDIKRRFTGDWGDWRVPLTQKSEDPCEEQRTGFYIHGGDTPGSAGCIDIGGGLFGNEITDQLLNDMLSDPDGIVDIEVW